MKLIEKVLQIHIARVSKFLNRKTPKQMPIMLVMEEKSPQINRLLVSLAA
jgi:hypothetical protein